MRISTITNWAYGITVVLTALSAGAFIMASRSANDERLAVEERLRLDELVEDLEIGAEVRSDEARLYVMRGEKRHLQAFESGENNEKRLEDAAARLEEHGLNQTESNALKQLTVDADALDTLERSAIAAYGNGDTSGAQQALFGPEHERLQSDLLGQVNTFRALVDARTGAAFNTAREFADWWSLAARAILGLTGALFLAVLYFILRRRITMPLARMTGIVSRLAKEDYAVEVPQDRRLDEIGEMNKAILVFRENGLERERLDAERRADQQTKDLLLQMMHRLQACQTEAELADIVARFAPQIFPDHAGGLYILSNDKSMLNRTGSWLDPQHSDPAFTTDACWALRRGRPHVSGVAATDVPCLHLHGEEAETLCIPLTAMGDMIGLLYLERPENRPTANAGAQLYLELIAENVGLAIANLQLRNTLTDLAERDALSGLYNRRFLNERLEHYRKSTSENSLACLMVDIDHFKRFNDMFGHDAGDMVIQHVAQIILNTLRDRGTAFRFGGEEFTVLIPDRGEDDCYALAEELRENAGRAHLSHDGRPLGRISISIGLAISPEDGPAQTLVSRADAALLMAKAKGRNQTVRAAETGEL